MPNQPARHQMSVFLMAKRRAPPECPVFDISRPAGDAPQCRPKAGGQAQDESAGGAVLYGIGQKDGRSQTHPYRQTAHPGAG
jgi:hypothetical protein